MVPAAERARLPATGSWGVLRHFTVGEMYGRFFTDEFNRSNSFMIYVYALSLGIAPWFSCGRPDPPRLADGVARAPTTPGASRSCGWPCRT